MGNRETEPLSYEVTPEKGSDIVTSVLQNLHLDHQSIVAVWNPNGRITIHQKVEGSRPNWETLRPIAVIRRVADNTFQVTPQSGRIHAWHRFPSLYKI